MSCEEIEAEGASHAAPGSIVVGDFAIASPSSRHILGFRSQTVQPICCSLLEITMVLPRFVIRMTLYIWGIFFSTPAFLHRACFHLEAD